MGEVRTVFLTQIIRIYMYLAYSALRTNNNKHPDSNSVNGELSLRYQAYLNTCIKYRNTYQGGYQTLLPFNRA